ncbi:Clavaminate synthase-like protein [Mycena floridula]|nr:Clavaminate synthase-like protein [Mycena floridula]
MPSLTVPAIPHYVPAPVTSEKLDYADLVVIDLTKASTFEGRQQLAAQVREAMSSYGFFYVINHGSSPAQTERIFDIADIPFSGVSDEEKIKYAGQMKQTGSYQGYKSRQYWHIDNGVKDQNEHYNVNRDVTLRDHPTALKPLLPEISEFARHNHLNVLHPILKLLALGLELPEDALVDLHGYSDVGETFHNRIVCTQFMRFQSYPRSEEEETKTKNVWLKGHTDFGTVTILYSQPVSALQILTLDGTWKWVRHIEGALVVNMGDAMNFLSGGIYPGTIHRVVQPPLDQQSYTRLGVFYFCMTNDNVTLKPLYDSPVLKRAGIVPRPEDADAPTMEAWRKGRTSAYGQSELKLADNGVEEEIINGRIVKHYN